MTDVYAPPSTSLTAEDESLSYRLSLMVKLAAAPGDHDSVVDQLILKLDGADLPYSSREVREHLAGTSIPGPIARRAYAQACQWHDDTSLLDDDPAVYLRPLMQSEIMLCTRVIGVPHFRGADGPMGLPTNASVDDLRAQWAQLRASGRLWRVEA